MATNQKEIKKAFDGGPTKKFRAGAIEVAVWENEITTEDGKTFKKQSVSMQRSYKDKNDEWQKTTNMNANDLPKLISLLQKAYDSIIVNKEE